MFGSLCHSGCGSSGSAPPLHPLGCIRSSRNPEPAAAALGSHRLIDLRHLARNPGLVLPSDPSRKLAPRPRRDPHVSGRVSAALLGCARLSGCTSIVAGSLRRCRLSVQSRHLRSALPAPTRCALVIVTGHELPQELRIGPAILTPALLSMTGGNESDSREQQRLKRILRDGRPYVTHQEVDFGRIWLPGWGVRSGRAFQKCWQPL
jgi:hypothetical protein